MIVTVWWLRLALRLIRQVMLEMTRPMRLPTAVVLRMQGWCLGLLAGLATKALTAVLLTMAQDWRVGLLRVWARLPLMEALLILLLMIWWVLLLLLTVLRVLRIMLLLARGDHTGCSERRRWCWILMAMMLSVARRRHTHAKWCLVRSTRPRAAWRCWRRWMGWLSVGCRAAARSEVLSR